MGEALTGWRTSWGGGVDWAEEWLGGGLAGRGCGSSDKNGVSQTQRLAGHQTPHCPVC